MKAVLHKIIPWWAKIAAKMILARLPIAPRTWHRLGLFVPGFMRDPEYAIRVFETHWQRAGAPGPGFRYLELGPGESLATAIVAWAYGADGGALVDAGDFAVRDFALYLPLIERLAQKEYVRDVGILTALSSVDSLLEVVNARVYTDGLAALKAMPSDSFDLIFSQAVLEHVPLAEFAATADELHRLQTANGVGSHRVDFRDHLQGSLHNLRFSGAIWERPGFAKRSGFYTNRLQFSKMVEIFDDAGFAVTAVEQNRWQSLPIDRAQMAVEFRSRSDDDLRTSGASLLLRKKQS